MNYLERLKQRLKDAKFSNEVVIIGQSACIVDDIGDDWVQLTYHSEALTTGWGPHKFKRGINSLVQLSAISQVNSTNDWIHPDKD